MSVSEGIPSLIPVAKFVGIAWPLLYSGITAQYSVTFVEPIIQHAPTDKIMARQWLHGYQYGPLWVPPLVGPSTVANFYLAYLANAAGVGWKRNAYIAAAVGIWSIFPITFFYMEPGINGACKWKVETLLKDEKDHKKMKNTYWYYPSAHMHGGTMASRERAERTCMKELISFWRRINNWRALIALLAGVASGYATLYEI